MRNGRLERFAPLFGALFAVLFAIGLLSNWDTPDSKASGQEVISHYGDEGKIFLGVFALLLGAILFLFFVGILQAALRTSERAPEWLATVVFGGGVIYSIALAIFAMGQFMLIEAANLGQPEVAQALNIFDLNNFFPAVVGLATILLATGWHTLRSAVLPVWLGWVSVVLGLLALAGPAGFMAFLLFPLWVLVVSVLLYRADAGAGLPRTGAVADLT
ncbi:MAG: hypothetical protein M3450_17015 [Actinomycetota bacterium]|nr:hypothetical protein [Actinomycetota bacterium]